MIIDHERDLRNKLRRYREEGFQKGFKEGFEEGYQKGFKQGFKEGFQKGLMDSKLNAVCALINSTDLSEQEIAAQAEVDEDLVHRTRKTLAADRA